MSLNRKDLFIYFRYSNLTHNDVILFNLEQNNLSVDNLRVSAIVKLPQMC